jgi:hypothetical protein
MESLVLYNQKDSENDSIYAGGEGRIYKVLNAPPGRRCQIPILERALSSFEGSRIAIQENVKSGRSSRV